MLSCTRGRSMDTARTSSSAWMRKQVIYIGGVKKYGYGRILLVEDKLVLLGNTGELAVVQATPDSFEEIYCGQLLSNARCWNGPALVNGYLFARNGEQIACFDWAN